MTESSLEHIDLTLDFIKSSVIAVVRLHRKCDPFDLLTDVIKVVPREHLSLVFMDMLLDSFKLGA